jgi:uncharacterized protein YndB with AHSA1/START domain
MSDYERTFVLAVSSERAWECFTNPEERAAWLALPDNEAGDHFTTAGGDDAGFTLVVDEVEPHARLRWTEMFARPEGRIEFCAVFEDVDTGCRITITQSRFGGIRDTHWEASHRGWDEAIADLAFYLRTGIPVRRHFFWGGATGFMPHETLAGVEVAEVLPDSFAAAAGLQAGDLVLDLAGAPIFRMSDLWALTRAHKPGDRLPIRYVRGAEVRQGEAPLSDPADFPQ